MKGLILGENNYAVGVSKVSLTSSWPTVIASNGKSVNIATCSQSSALTQTGPTNNSQTYTKNYYYPYTTINVNRTSAYNAGASSVTLSRSGATVTASNNKSASVAYATANSLSTVSVSNGTVTITPTSSQTGTVTYDIGDGYVGSIIVNRTAPYNAGYSAAGSALTISKGSSNCIITAAIGSTTKTYTYPNVAGGTYTFTSLSDSQTRASGNMLSSALVCSISSTEQAKIIAANIKKGVTILGVAGTFEGYVTSPFYIWNGSSGYQNHFTSGFSQMYKRNTSCTFSSATSDGTIQIESEGASTPCIVVRTNALMNLANYSSLKIVISKVVNSGSGSSIDTSLNYAMLTGLNITNGISDSNSSVYTWHATASNTLTYSLSSMSDIRFLYLGGTTWNSYINTVHIKQIYFQT